MTLLTGVYEKDHPSADSIRAEVQGWVLKGYNHDHARHVIAEVADRAAAQALLRAITGGNDSVLQVSSGTKWRAGKPDVLLNIGISHKGLAALGVSDQHLQTFPVDFIEGPVARAEKLGDVGKSDPKWWDPGFREPERLHLMLSLHGRTPDLIEAQIEKLLAVSPGALRVLTQREGTAQPDGHVHFGYKDGIAQPQIDGFGEYDSQPDRQREAPLGEFVLGHRSQFEDVEFRVPEPATLGHNGTFNAFRVLEQDVVAFENFLDEAVATHPRLGDRELVAAKLMGRWRNGNPIDPENPTQPGEKIPADKLNDFKYGTDVNGAVCPIGAHTRRSNPRDTPIVQKGFGHTRRIIRRGMPYGPMYDHSDPNADRKVRRGLLGSFLCASLTAQFENIMYDWVNLGLHHPSITGTNDPILGDNDPETSEFLIPMPDGDDIVLRGFGRFVETRGSAYLFMPSIPALRWLGAGADQ